MRRHRSQILPWVAAFLFLIAGLGYLGYNFIQRTLLPPKTVVFAAGPQNSGYYNVANQYRAILARDGIQLEIRETAGSSENAVLLEAGDVDVALLQGGIEVNEDIGLRALAAVFLEPFFILHRGGLPDTADPSRWRDLRVAVGPEGSGTRAAVNAMMQGLGIDPNDETLLPLGGAEAAAALLDGSADVAVFVAPLTAPYLQRVLNDPSVTIDTVRDSEALARSLAFIRMVDIPRSGIDYVTRQPPDKVVLTAMIASLVGQPDLHPALVNRLVRAAQQIHSGSNLLSDTLSFPSAEGSHIPMNALAREALTSPPGWLERNLPYWAAAQIRSLALFFVPLLLIMIPVLRSFPVLFAWQMRARIFRYYRELLDVEAILANGVSDREQQRDLIARLDEIDAAMSQLNVPVRFREYSYTLKIHVDLIRRRLRDALNQG